MSSVMLARRYLDDSPCIVRTLPSIRGGFSPALLNTQFCVENEISMTSKLVQHSATVHPVVLAHVTVLNESLGWDDPSGHT